MKRPAFLLFLSVASSSAQSNCGPNHGGASCGPNLCCSTSGWCGTTYDHCNTMCDPAYGSCGNFNWCGGTWADAQKCGVSCFDSVTCPPGEECFADVTTCPIVEGPAPPPGPPPPPPPPPPTNNHNWCGYPNDWSTAEQCTQSCFDGTDAECLAWGMSCYSGITACPAVTGPSPPTSPPPPPPPPTDPPTPAPKTPNPTPPTNPPPPVAGGDSRVIAYVGNWQNCPTAAQLDGYTHLVIAFAVSYAYNEAGPNYCDPQCNIPSSIPLCVGQTATQIADWKGMGKKVILSFGGAGMGGSWSGDNNNCWDYCFGKEEALSTALVSMVSSEGYDGIDIDYEYCYDTAGGRHSGCSQVSAAYSDAAAQNFLTQMNVLLRDKMDALGPGYELTHAPMDSDMQLDSPYYQILRSQRDKLNFIMPQFYNGITRPVADGFDGTLGNEGDVDTYQVYSLLANDMFGVNRPDKVVFGFCLANCANPATGAQAADVMSQVKGYNGGEFSCNGGAFFWVAFDDVVDGVDGAWSDPVYAEVSQTAGCSTGGTLPPTPPPTPPPTEAGTCSDGSGVCADVTECACSARRRLSLRSRTALKGSVHGRMAEERTLSDNKRANNLRKLAKPAPKTPNPTNPPTPQPTSPPTEFQCTCNTGSPPPPPPATPEPTPPPTPPPTEPTGGPCDCGVHTQKNLCEGSPCGCSWSGRLKECISA